MVIGIVQVGLILYWLAGLVTGIVQAGLVLCGLAGQLGNGVVKAGFKPVAWYCTSWLGIVCAGILAHGLAGRLGNGYKDASTRARLVIRANLAGKPRAPFCRL